MTTVPIAPSPTAPAVLSVDASGGSPDPTTPGDFLALVQRALADALGAPVTPGASGQETKDEDVAKDTDTDPGLDESMPAAAMSELAAVVAPMLPVQVVPAPVRSADGPADSPAESTASPMDGAPDDRPIGLAAGTPGTAPVGPITDSHQDHGSPSRAATTTEPAVEPTTSGLEGTASVPDNAPAEQLTPVAGASPSIGSTPVAAPAVPVATSVAPTGTAAVAHVTGQVFPEVTSLVTRGDGTHRITLTLNPEALGEVRVVMTVRDGSVHVRLAAGQEAQHALLDGSSELTRLLERAGVVDSRIVVRDLPVAPASSTAPGPDLGAGGTGPQDQHAGTRAQQPAMDGTHDGTRHRRGASGANPPRSNEPVTHTRAAGVDVTM
jgi:flagellar hook-length control protein FliK